MDADRRLRLKALFSGPRFKGDRAKLIEQSGLTKGRIAQFFDDGQAFGERAARALAGRLHLPPRYFDEPMEAHGTTSTADSAEPTQSEPGQSAGIDDALREGLGHIAATMLNEGQTKREMVALLMRDIATKPEALETTLGMLFQIVGVSGATAASVQKKVRMKPGAERLQVGLQAHADATLSNAEPLPPGVIPIPERRDSIGGNVAPQLLGKKAKQQRRHTDKTEQKG